MRKRSKLQQIKQTGQYVITLPSTLAKCFDLQKGQDLFWSVGNGGLNLKWRKQK